MIFRIKWGDLERKLRQQFVTEQSNSSPIFYFEDEETISIYQAIGYIVICSSITKDSLEGLEAFKMEFLKNATELVEPLTDKTTLVIKQV